MNNRAALHDLHAMRRRLLSVLVAGCFGSAFANPLGPQVVNGQVSFVNQGNALTITNSPGSIINWQGFSIDQNEVTRFIQQNPNSTVLNRIVGQDPSRILGALQSNGRVFLINPNGILFGKGAQVDVNGLAASTLNIGNDDFIKGKWNFQAGVKAGDLKNEGTINTPAGGLVYLIAPNVENSGIITSPKGEVLLAAGRSVQLADSANPDLHVVVSAPEDRALNLGQIVVQSGKAGIYGALINQRGIVSADSAEVGANGKIVFKASKESILDSGSRTSATGAGKGGDIHILGEHVGLAGGAKVDASGQLGGGTVLIGGDYQGKNPDLQNASRTYVDREAEIKADAIQNSDGGKVIVWSNDFTRNYGRISAKGGAQGGNGGFVESSGKKKLDHHAKVEVSAPKGSGGTLLLDPAAITIVGGSGDGAATPDGTATFLGSSITGTVNFADGDLTSTGVSNIYQSELEGLAPGTHLILEATDLITATGTFSNLVTLPNNSNLTLRTRNASSDGTGNIGINLVSSTDTSNLEFKTQGTGTITMQTGTGTSPQAATINVGKLTTDGGQVSLSASGNVVVRGIVTTPSANGNGGNISISASGGFLSLGGANIDARGNSGTTGNVTLSSAGDISMQNGTTIYGNQLKIASVSGVHGTATTDTMATQVSTLNVINGGTGDIRISNAGGNLSIDDIGSTGYGMRQMTSGQGIFVTNATGYGITVNNQIVTNNGPVSLTGPAALTLTASNPIATGTGNITLATSDAEALLSMPAGSSVSSAGGAFITLKSDKMSLLGTINAGTTGGIVKLAPVNANPIHLATVGTDSTANTLELAAAELNSITASTLVVGDATSGAIDIKGQLLSGSGGALEHITAALKLNSSGAITQQTNATIDGASSVSANGYSVTLTEANGTGVISGSTTNGDFKYRSINQIAVNNVDNVSGITVPASSKIYLESDFATLGIMQSSGSPLVGGSLVVKTKGRVELLDANNDIANVVGDLSVGGTGSGKFLLYNKNDLTVGGGPLFSISGLATNNQSIIINTAAGKTLTVSEAINAGTGYVELEADNLSISTGTVAATDVSMHPATAGRKITVGDTVCAVGPCLIVNDLYKISASAIGIGSDDANKQSGDITVIGLTDTNSNAVTDIKNGVTTRIGLFTGGSVTQTNPITVNDLGVIAGGAVTLGLPNMISNLAAKTAGSNFTFVNNQGFSVGTLSGGIAPDSDYYLNGISTFSGNVSLSASAGNIALGAPVNAGTGTVTLSSPAGAISQSSGVITGSSFSASAADGIGHGGVISTKVSSLTGASVSSASKDINILNTGALTVSGTVSTTSGNISLKTKSPLTISSSGLVQTTAGGNITLEAGASGSTSDTLTIAGKIDTAPGANVVVSTTGPVLLKAGASIVLTDTVAGNVTLQANLNPVPQPPAPLPPTIDQCTVNPSLSGCSTVLPTLSTCTATPTAAGCTAVLPSLSTCTSTPTAAGCTAVLPSLSACTSTPTAEGCTAVLPSLSTCTTAPTKEGCTAVLPSLSICTITPTAEGCAAVLPTLSTCTTAPTKEGCTAVLPSLSTCTTMPTKEGCTAVLPTLSTCTTAPTKEGCTAVLPSLSTCTITPTAEGCTAVLPTLSTCTTTPTKEGCTVVLPPLSTCTTTPTKEGCTAVLPSLSTCTTTPTAPGCAVVLPSLNTCTTAPATAGCNAVLPSISACTAAPATTGCSVVLPSLSSCIETPSQAGCSTVLPSLSQCSENIIQTGCGTVLPTLSQCAANPNTAGCSVVLPTASKCTINPALAGCEVVLPPVQPGGNPSDKSGNATTGTIAAIANTTTNTVVGATTTAATTYQSKSGDSTEKTASGSESKPPETRKSDNGKKDDKKATASQQDDGVKKNDAAKKMYCN